MSRFKHLRFALLLACLVVALAVSLVASDRQAQAASPRYSIINAAGGVYWRAQPDWNTPIQKSGYGVYNGTVVEISCVLRGTTVPGSLSHLWYQATDVGGPGLGSGLVHDHFINTPWSDPDHVIPGVPGCGSVPPVQPPTLPPGGAVFYRPFNGPGGPGIPGDVKAYDLNEWSGGGNCSDSKATFPLSYDSKTVTILAGWSVGRLGPLYVLANHTSVSNIDMIVLFDPGSYNDFFGHWWLPFETKPCDLQYNVSQLYGQWLTGSPNRELLILAGSRTKDSTTGGTHQGIQQMLFPDIRGLAIARQVLVCNYDDLGHSAVLQQFSYILDQGHRTTCPTKSGVKLYASWHP